MIVLAPLALGLSLGRLFPLNVENDASVEPTPEIWVVAIFERRFCGEALAVDGADKSDELASGRAVGAAGSPVECGGPRLSGPASRDPGAPGLGGPAGPTFSLTVSSSFRVSSGTGATFWKEFICEVESDFSGSFLKGSRGESAILRCGAGSVLLTATEVRGAWTVL